MSMMLGEARGMVTLDISDLQKNAALASVAINDLDNAGSGRGIAGLEKQLNAAGVSTTQLGMGLMTVGGLLGAPMILGVKNAADLEHQLKAIESSLDMDDRGRLSEIKEMIIDIGASGQFSAGEMALVTEELVKSGFAIDQILSGDPADGFGNMTQAVSDLASATGSSLDTAVRAVSSSMQIWSEAVVGTEIALTDASRAADILTVAANASAADVEDISAGMRNFGPVAAAMGISFEDASAAIAYFTNYGIKATVAGTALSTGLSRLADPTGEAADLMQQLGINAFDTQGKFVGLPALMDQLKTATKGLTMEQKLAAMQTIFGLEAMDAMMLMAETGSEPLTNITEQMKQYGIAGEQAALRTQTLRGALERMWEGIQTFFMVLSGGLVAPLTFLANLVDHLVGLLMSIPTPILTAIGVLITLASVVAIAGGAFLLIYPKIQQFRTILMALSGVQGPLQGIASRILGLVGPTNKAALAFRALRMAMMGGLLFVGLPWLWDNNFLGIPKKLGLWVDSLKSEWDRFKGIFSSGGEELKKDIDPIMGQMERIAGSGADGFDYLVKNAAGETIGKQLESWTNDDGTVGVKVELENGDIVEGTIDMLTGEYNLNVETEQATGKVRTLNDKLNDLKAWNNEKGIGFLNPIVDAVGKGIGMWGSFSNGVSKTMGFLGGLNTTYADLAKNFGFVRAAQIMWAKDPRLAALPHSFEELGNLAITATQKISNGFRGMAGVVDGIPIIGGPLSEGLNWISDKLDGMSKGAPGFFQKFPTWIDQAKSSIDDIRSLTGGNGLMGLLGFGSSSTFGGEDEKFNIDDILPTEGISDWMLKERSAQARAAGTGMPVVDWLRSQNTGIKVAGAVLLSSLTVVGGAIRGFRGEMDIIDAQGGKFSVGAIGGAILGLASAFEIAGLHGAADTIRDFGLAWIEFSDTIGKAGASAVKNFAKDIISGDFRGAMNRVKSGLLDIIHPERMLLGTNSSEKNGSVNVYKKTVAGYLMTWAESKGVAKEVRTLAFAILHLSKVTGRVVRNMKRGMNVVGDFFDFYRLSGKFAATDGASGLNAWQRAYESLAMALSANGFDDAAENVRRFGRTVDEWSYKIQGAFAVISSEVSKLASGDFSTVESVGDSIMEGLSNIGEFAWNLVLGEPAIAFGFDVDEAIQNAIGWTATVLVDLVIEWLDGWANDPAQTAILSLIGVLGTALANLALTGNLSVLFRFVRVLGLFGIAAYVIKQIYDYFKANPAKIEELKVEFGRVWADFEEGPFGALFKIMHRIYDAGVMVFNVINTINNAINALPGPLNRINDALARMMSAVAGKQLLIFLGGGITKNQGAIQAMIKGLWELAKFPFRLMIRPQEVLQRLTNFMLNKGTVGRPNRGIIGFFRQFSSGMFDDIFRGASLATKGITRFIKGLNTPMKLPIKDVAAFVDSFRELTSMFAGTNDIKAMKKYANAAESLWKAVNSGDEKRIKAAVKVLNKLQESIGIFGDDVFDVKQMAYIETMPNKFKRIQNAFRALWQAAKGPSDEISKLVLQLDEFGNLITKEIPVGNRKLTLINKTARFIEASFRAITKAFLGIFEVMDRVDKVTDRLAKRFPRITAAFNDLDAAKAFGRIDDFLVRVSAGVRSVGAGIAEWFRGLGGKGIGSGWLDALITKIDNFGAKGILRMSRIGDAIKDRIINPLYRAFGGSKGFLNALKDSHIARVGKRIAGLLGKALDGVAGDFARGIVRRATPAVKFITTAFLKGFKKLTGIKPLGFIALDAKQMKAADRLLDIIGGLAKALKKTVPKMDDLRSISSRLLAPIRSLARPFQALDSLVMRLSKFLPGINDGTSKLLRYGSVGAVAAAVGWALWETNLWGFRDAFGGLVGWMGEAFGGLYQAWQSGGMSAMLDKLLDDVSNWFANFPSKMADILSSASWGPLISWGATIASFVLGGPLLGTAIALFQKDIEKGFNNIIESGRRIFQVWEKNGPTAAFRQFTRELSISSKKLGEYFTDFGESMKEIGDVLGRIPVIGGVLHGVFDTIGSAVSWVGGKLSTFGENLRQALLGGAEPAEALGIAFRQTFPELANFIDKLGDIKAWVDTNIPGIKTAWEGFKGVVINALQTIGNLISGDFDSAMRNFNEMLDSGGQLLSGTFSAISDAIAAVDWEAVSKKLRDFGNDLMKAGGLGVVAGALLYIFSWAIDAIRIAIDLGTDAYDKVKSFLKWVAENVPGGEKLYDLGNSFNDLATDIIKLTGAIWGLQIAMGFLGGAGLFGRLAGGLRALLFPLTLAAAGFRALKGAIGAITNSGVIGTLLSSLGRLGPVGWAAVAAITLAIVAYKTNFLGFGDYIRGKVGEVKDAWDEFQKMLDGKPFDWRTMVMNNEMIVDVVEGIQDMKAAWDEVSKIFSGEPVDWALVLDLMGLGAVVDKFWEVVGAAERLWGLITGGVDETPAETAAPTKQPGQQFTIEPGDVDFARGAWTTLFKKMEHDPSKYGMGEEITITAEGAVKFKSTKVALNNPGQMWSAIETQYQQLMGKPITWTPVLRGTTGGMATLALARQGVIGMSSDMQNGQTRANSYGQSWDSLRATLTPIRPEMMATASTVGSVGTSTTGAATEVSAGAGSMLGSLTNLNVGGSGQISSLMAAVINESRLGRTSSQSEMSAMSTEGIASFERMRSGVIAKSKSLWSGSVLESRAGSTSVISAITKMKNEGHGQFDMLRSSSLSSTRSMRSGVTSEYDLLRSRSVGSVTTMNKGVSNEASRMSSSLTASFSSMRSRGVSEAIGMKSSVSSSVRSMASTGKSQTDSMMAGMVGKMMGGKLRIAVAGSGWVSTVSGIGPSMSGAGRSVGAMAAEGVAAGIWGALGSVQAASRAIISTVTATMAFAAMIHSPSRLTEREIGEPLTQGVAEGMVNTRAMAYLGGKATQVVSAVASRIKSAASDQARDLDISSQVLPATPTRPVSTLPTASSGGGTTVTVNNNNTYMAVTGDDLNRMVEGVEKANSLDEWANDPKSFSVGGR